jgi:hypothetical protein
MPLLLGDNKKSMTHIPKILIIFPETHLKHSPTLLNLINELKKVSDVVIICKKHHQNKNFTIKGVRIYYLDILKPFTVNQLIMNCARIGDAFFYRILRKRFFTSYLLLKIFKSAIRKNFFDKNQKFDSVIGVDPIGALAGLSIYGKCNLLSLEIYESDLINKLLYLKRENFKSLMTQSEERELLLLPNFNGHKFYIQNAPIYINTNKGDYYSHKIISLGSFIPKMGSELILKFAQKYSDYEIVLKGLIPEGINNKLPSNVQVEEKYIDQEDLTSFLKEFEIGLCIYDIKKIPLDEYNHFNHLPSGKMYNYFNALVPCIGNKCEGLQPIEIFGAGILLEDTSEKKINLAIKDIQKNYPKYLDGCKKAAIHFDFIVNSREYIKFLINDGK